MLARIFTFSVFTPFLLSAGIVSLDLCADQWVLGFGQSKDIHSISYLAKDSDLSYEAAQAHQFTTHTGSIEKLIDPSIKIMFGYEPISPVLKQLCKKRGIKLISLSYPQSFAELKKQTLFLSKIFKNVSLGQQWVRKLESFPLSCQKTALFYGAQGFCPGKKTLLNEILEASGYRNLYNRKEGWTYNSLESLLSQSLSVIFLLSPSPTHSFWNTLQKKGTLLRPIPHRLSLCPYPPAVFELINSLKKVSHG